jgi:two-component system sensor histidine kinase KdpD
MPTSIALSPTNIRERLRTPAQCLAAAVVLALLTYGGFALQVNQLTISLLYLLVVVIVASLFGFAQASVASVLAVLLLDYYFEPPLFSLEVASPAIFVALVTFEVTALAISRFHGKEMRTAREAAIQLAGMEQLYELSRSTMLLDLRQPPGPQLVVLIQRIFNAPAVALFDSSRGRQDRAGEWGAHEEDLAKQCYLSNEAQDDPQTQTAQRILRAGSESVGALVVRGKLSALVVDALASLAAIAIDRHRSFEKEDRAETARQSEQLRATVLDALAHEFKTPLTAVHTASSGLLEMGGMSDAQTSLVTLIDGEAERLTDLCTRMLKTAKLNPEQLDLETTNVNVQELVSEVLAAQRLDEERNSIRVTVDSPALSVCVDRELLGMILAQYIDNARKYSVPGTPIEIAARKSHSEVLLSVHNIGPSIRIEDRERIFDRFYRSPDVKDTVSGTGIGLSVVRKAAEAHHGHVWVISEDKQGTTFFLSLPEGARRTR